MFPEKKGWYGGNLLRESKVTGFTNCSSIFALKEATVQGKLALNPPSPAIFSEIMGSIEETGG